MDIGFTGVNQCAQMWGLGTGATMSQLTGVESEPPGRLPGRCVGVFGLGTKAKACKTGTSTQRDKAVQDRPVLLGSKGGITKVVSRVLPNHPILQSLTNHSWYSLRRIVEALDASTASSSALSIGFISATARLM